MCSYLKKHHILLSAQTASLLITAARQCYTPLFSSYKGAGLLPFGSYLRRLAALVKTQAFISSLVTLLKIALAHHGNKQSFADAEDSIVLKVYTVSAGHWLKLNDIHYKRLNSIRVRQICQSAKRDNMVTGVLYEFSDIVNKRGLLQSCSRRVQILHPRSFLRLYTALALCLHNYFCICLTA